MSTTVTAYREATFTIGEGDTKIQLFFAKPTHSLGIVNISPITAESAKDTFNLSQMITDLFYLARIKNNVLYVSAEIYIKDHSTIAIDASVGKNAKELFSSICVLKKKKYQSLVERYFPIINDQFFPVCGCRCVVA